MYTFFSYYIYIIFTFNLHKHYIVQTHHTPTILYIIYIILIIINPHGLIYMSLQFCGYIYISKNNSNSFSHLSNQKYNYLTISEIKMKKKNGFLPIGCFGLLLSLSFFFSDL